MASTLNIVASYPYLVGSPTATVKYVDFTLNCTLNSTNTTTTVTFNKITATRPSDFSGTNPACSVISDGKTIATAVPGFNYTFSDKSSSWARGTADATKTISFIVSGPNGGSSGNTKITVPKLLAYAIVYHANGGSNPPAKQTKYYGKTLKLSSTKPTRTNYVFKNWNTASGGTGTSYSPGGSYTANAAATLYAQWYPPYTVSYDANGGTGAPANQAKVYNTTLKLTTAKPSRTNAVFSTWNTKADGSGTNYAPGASYTANAALKLYAIWVPKPQVGTLTAIRCDSTGAQDDEGTYADISCTWSLDATVNPSVKSASVSGTIKAQSTGATTALTLSGATSGTGGTAKARPGNLDTDEQYTVTVTVTAGTQSTSKSVILTRAFFTLDFKAGGKSVGIGRAAPQDGCLEIGFPTVFDQTVDIYGSEFIDGSNSSHLYFKDGYANCDYDGVPTSGANTTRVVGLIDLDLDHLARLSLRQRSDGRRCAGLEARGFNSSGTTIWNALWVVVDKNGNRSYELSDPEAFCEAINVGDYVTASGSSKSCPTSEYTDICDFTLPAGTWLVMASVEMGTGSTTTGRRVASIGTGSEDSSSLGVSFRATEIPPPGGPARLKLMGVVRPTASTKYYFKVWHNQGAAINSTGTVQAVRIK